MSASLYRWPPEPGYPDVRRDGLTATISHGGLCGLPADAVTTDVITDRGGYGATVAAYVGGREV